MRLTRPLAAFVLFVAASTLACGSASDSASDQTDPSTESAASSTYDRQTVYNEVRDNAHAPGDLLSSRITDGKLVDALGWLVDQNPPSFYITAIRTDHHNDGQKAHAGGHCLDMYARDSSEAKRLIELANKDPFVVEIGLGGAYKAYRGAVTDKLYFNDNNATHVHIGTIRAFGR